MKILTGLAMLIFMQSAFCVNYGKFKITEKTGARDEAEAIFLMNSQGDISFLENDYYAKIQVDSFFGEVTLRYKGMGDEDATEALFTLKDNKLVSSCSALIDYKNEYVSWATVELLRWNKFKKKYENIETEEVAATSEACFDKLLENYQDYDDFH